MHVVTLDAKPPEIATLIRAASALERLAGVLRHLDNEGRIAWGIQDQAEFELRHAETVAADIRKYIRDAPLYRG